MLEELRAQPPAPVVERSIEPFDLRYGVDLLGPDGTWFDRVENEISPGRAVELLTSGAQVAWDACGCGGFCGFIWLDDDSRARLRKAGRPQIGGRVKRGQWGVMSHWRSAAGADLIVAEAYVRWGAELA
ncbi:hypothetical protein ACIB24_15710 [Spongisporangium articulatum]|uniref:Uncharacterized protein n=1 Tax=Spongisporangium articulatum TaxID=3362603 RepID=A0ABW8ASE8_9ACTN